MSQIGDLKDARDAILNEISNLMNEYDVNTPAELAKRIDKDAEQANKDLDIWVQLVRELDEINYDINDLDG